MYFNTRLQESIHLKLSELDWEILEGLEEVLAVSHQHPGLGTGTHFIALAGSSRIPAVDVVRVNADLIACYRALRDVHERMGTTQEMTQHSQALDGHWRTLGY